MKPILVTEQNTSIDVLRCATEASALGLRPGEWPAQIETTLGNKRPFVLYAVNPKSGSRSYRQDLGCLDLRVFND